MMKIFFHNPAMAIVLFFVCTASAQAQAAISNVIVGGGERRCSSFTGAQAGRDCKASWDTILREDPAFAGLSMEDVLFEPEHPQPAPTYAIDAPRLSALQTVPQALMNPDRKRALMAQFQSLLARDGARSGLAWETVKAELNTAQPTMLEKLTLAETALLRSALADAPAVARRKVQGRSIPFSTNTASVEITRAFVQAASERNHGRTPLIGVVTASAGPHPFVDHDINVYSLKSAGARVVYLPFEGGFRKALDAQDCARTAYYYTSYANTNPERPVLHADLQFPELFALQKDLCANNARKLNAALRQLHGIYFSGGNQARHLESLVGKDAQGEYTVASPQLRIIQQRHAQGKLVVAGTSAGNHVQGGGTWRGRPVPMIGGGDSYGALMSGFQTGIGPAGELPVLGRAEASMTYAPALYGRGGLGLFPYGVLDSHFSRRTREARLVRAVADSGMDYGFGVDENTALLVTRPDRNGTTHFSVQGAAGVFITDLREAHKPPLDNKHPFQVQNAIAHYLLPGDIASIDRKGQLSVHLSSQRPVLPLEPNALPAQQDRVLDYGSTNFLRLASTMGRTGAEVGLGTTENSNDKRSTQNSPLYATRLSRQGGTQFRGVAANPDDPVVGVAYTDLRIAFFPCTASCQDAADFRLTISP